MIIALKLSIWLIAILTNVWFAKDREKPNYLLQGILRAMASIIHGCFFVHSEEQWGLYATLVIFQMTSFWLIFEAVLNLIWGEKLLYYDRKEKDSGWIDRFFAWTGPGEHLIAKIGALILMILSIIVIYHQA